AARRQRWQRAWCPSPSESRHEDRSCGRRRFAASPGSSRLMTYCLWKACFLSRRVSTHLASTRTRPRTCSSSGKQPENLSAAKSNFHTLLKELGDKLDQPIANLVAN